METTKDCFSNGTEFHDWLENNCERCTKNLLNNCMIHRELFSQAFGGGSVSLRTYEVCQMADCPEREEFYKKINSYEDC